ncbi:MAG: hypothetical protein AAB772_00875 [Patescibacteria group bacterium]
MQKYSWIRKVYLYTFALVGLVLIVIGAVQLIGLALKTYIFTKADIYYQYPISRPVKIVPPDAVIGAGEKTEFQEPSKEEVEEYERNQRSSQRQREAAGALAMIIVGAPLYWYHWRVIKKDKEENNDK